MSVASVVGIITLVQEHRFKLVDDQGVESLFILAHDAPLEGPELQRLEEEQVRVRVGYSLADDLIATVAHDVAPAGGSLASSAWHRVRHHLTS